MEQHWVQETPLWDAAALGCIGVGMHVAAQEQLQHCSLWQHSFSSLHQRVGLRKQDLIAPGLLIEVTCL